MEVQPGSPAAQAGLKPGDVIVKLADHDVADTAALRILTAGLDVGAQVPMTFYRDGKAQTATVTIAELPAAPEVLFSLGLGLRERPADKEDGRTVIEIDRVVTGSPAFQSACGPACGSWPSATPEPVSTLAQFEAASCENLT